MWWWLYLKRPCPLPVFAYFLIISLYLGRVTKTSTFDVLGLRLSYQLSLWCIKEQLRQILLIVPLTLGNNKALGLRLGKDCDFGKVLIQ